VAAVVHLCLHNASQLAGFAKADHLAFFPRGVGGLG
jgi:hypothetical protein